MEESCNTAVSIGHGVVQPTSIQPTSEARGNGVPRGETRRADEEEIVFYNDTERSVGKETETLIVHSEENKNNSNDVVSKVKGDEHKPRRDSLLSKYHCKLSVMRNDRDEDATKCPADCYSLMSLNGPTTIHFWFGFLIFVFQMAFVVLILLSVLVSEYKVKITDDNPRDHRLGDIVAADADPLVRTTQFISLIAMLIFADASMLDVVIAIQTFPTAKLATEKDKLYCMRFSCLLRFIQGFSALFLAFVLVVSSSSVIDIILNFTALNFISALDDVAFEFAESGKYG